MSQTIELVVCDMAGTTVKDEREVERCFLQAANSTGLDIDLERCVAMMGLAKKYVFETLWAEQLGREHPDYESRVEASFASFRDTLETHYQTEPVEPTEGCLDLFRWLKAEGIKIALTTGFYREVTNIILQRLGWDQGLNGDYVGSAETIVQASVTPSEIYNNQGRPAPYMIQRAMYQLGVVDSRKVINIGDTPSDLQTGYNANCLYSFAVTNGTHTQAQLAAHRNDGLFASLRDFQAKLVELKGAA